AMGLLNSPGLGSPLYGHPWGFWLCIWLAAAMSALLGLVIGAPTLRVRGDYLAIITLGFGEIIPVAIRNLGDVTIEIGGWRPIERLNLTGGENGVNPVGRPYLPGVPFETDPVPWYFLILIIGAASVWAVTRLRDSRLGRARVARPHALALVLLRPGPGAGDAAAASRIGGPARATARRRGCRRGGRARRRTAARRGDSALAARANRDGSGRAGRRAPRRARTHEGLRRRRGAECGRSGGSAWRHHRPDRSQRRGQDDVLQRGHGPHPAGRRPPHVRRRQSRRAATQRDRRARHRAHLPVHPPVSVHDRARQRAGRRALPARGARGRRRAAAAAREGRGGARPRAGALTADVRRPERQGRRARAQSAVRRSAAAGDRARARDGAAAAPARRADRGHEP